MKAKIKRLVRKVQSSTRQIGPQMNFKKGTPAGDINRKTAAKSMRGLRKALRDSGFSARKAI